MFISLYKTCIYTQTHTLNFSEVLNLMSVFSPSIVAFDRNKIAHSWVWHTILNCLNCQVHGTVQLSPMYNWRCTGDRNQDHPHGVWWGEQKEREGSGTQRTLVVAEGFSDDISWILSMQWFQETTNARKESEKGIVNLCISSTLKICWYPIDYNAKPS